MAGTTRRPYEAPTRAGCGLLRFDEDESEDCCIRKSSERLQVGGCCRKVSVAALLRYSTRGGISLSGPSSGAEHKNGRDDKWGQAAGMRAPDRGRLLSKSYAD